MKKASFWLVFGVVLLWGITESAFYFAKQKNETAVVQATVNPSNPEETYIEPKTTAELERYFTDFDRNAVPRIFVKNFPVDFGLKGNSALFAKVLLPYLLKENEQLEKDRVEILALCTKVFQNKPLTASEEMLWNAYVTRYEIFEPDKPTEAQALTDMVDKISPSLAIAQALEETYLGRVHLNSVFGLYHWNDEGKYVRTTYPTLQEQVEAYVLQMNRAPSYYRWRDWRKIHRPTRYNNPGRVFLKGLEPYHPEDREYIVRVDRLYEKYQLETLDFSHLQKKGNK